MGRFSRSLDLVKASLNVLLSEKELLGFTLLSGVFTLIALVLLAVPGALLELASRSAGTPDSWGHSPLGWVLLFVFYLVLSFITLYFNTALTGAALNVLRGGDASFAQGMAVARQNAGRILGYALITATVGIILALIEERFRFIGQIIGGILGAAWGVVTFLVIPVMVAEGTDPFNAIKRSGQLLTKTWGEQIIGSGGIGVVAAILSLLAVVPAGLGIFTGTAAGAIAGIAIAVLYLALVTLVASALNGIYRAAVYLYAANGAVPAQFDAGMLRNAFRPRKGQSSDFGA